MLSVTVCVCVCVLQRSWVGASKKQCEELLEFIRHLAEDDKEGVMAVKVSTRAPPLASVYQSINTLCTHTWWCHRCWTCCGTWPTEMTVLLTRWTTPSAPTSRSSTTPAHRYMSMYTCMYRSCLVVYMYIVHVYKFTVLPYSFIVQFDHALLLTSAPSPLSSPCSLRPPPSPGEGESEAALVATLCGGPQQ